MDKTKKLSTHDFKIGVCPVFCSEYLTFLKLFTYEYIYDKQGMLYIFDVVSMMKMFDAGTLIKPGDPLCKKCGSDRMAKSGVIGGRQRFRCKVCGCNFRVGDGRTDEQIAAKKLLCVLLHFLGKDSYRVLGRLLQTDHAMVYRWVKEFDGNLPKTDVPNELKELEFDELLQFIDSKKNVLSSKSLTVADGELWPGCLATIILQLPTNQQ